MLRTIAVSAFLFLLPGAATVQDGRTTLTISVVLQDGEGKPAPVPRHVLLVSDNPPTAAPRRIQTNADGTATLRVRPGSYTVESDRPAAFGGKAYEWTQLVEVAPGRDAALELTLANAEAATANTAVSGIPTAADADPSSLLTRWQHSVVALWSPTARASGFIADPKGLIVTNGRVVGTASSVEVEVTPALKVAAHVLVADATRDVAVLSIDPKLAAAVPAVALGCGEPGKPVGNRQEIVALGAPFRGGKRTTSGEVLAVEGRVIVADFVLAAGASGGPVFAPGGHLVGVSSLPDETGSGRRGDARVVRVEEICASVASAGQILADAAAPDGRPLPMEPQRPFPFDVLKGTAPRDVPSLDSYRASSSSYEFTFITPALLYAARNQPAPRTSNRRGGGNVDPRTIDPLDDFSNWAGYVAELPPVLMIRVTPKLAEGFWTRIARGAAQTQGVSLPPIKRFKPGFARLQAFCGDVEVMPIHPFKLEQRVSESEAIYEGLYVFDASALAPSCAAVRLVAYSEKEPKRGETRVIDVQVIQQVWSDFAAYRALEQ